MFPQAKTNSSLATLVAPLLGLVLLLSFSASAGPIGKTQEAIDRTYAVQAAAETHVKRLALEGARGRSTLDKLLGEGFMCGFEKVRKNDRPLLFCTKSAPSVPDCAVLELYVFLDWNWRQQTLEQLVPELEKAKVTGVEPICKLPFKNKD